MTKALVIRWKTADGRPMRSSGALAYALNPADSVHYLQRLLPLAYLAFVWGALFFASMS